MAQAQSPETFVNGQQVTGTRLNNHVNGLLLLPGAITDQSALTANTLASGDEFLINDLSANALRRVGASSILNSGLSVTTSSITGNAASDIVITPPATYKVDVAGNLESDNLTVTNDLTVVDDASVGGDLVVSQTTTLTGAVTVSSTSSFAGVANFTGGFQVNGGTVYSLVSVVEENIPNFTGVAANTLHSMFISSSQTKPAAEIWVFELDALLFNGNNNTAWHYRITDGADVQKFVIGYFRDLPVYTVKNISHTFMIGAGISHTGTFVLRVNCTQGNAIVSPTSAQLGGYPETTQGSVGKFRIYKYRA